MDQSGSVAKDLKTLEWSSEDRDKKHADIKRYKNIVINLRAGDLGQEDEKEVKNTMKNGIREFDKLVRRVFIPNVKKLLLDCNANNT